MKILMLCREPRLYSCQRLKQACQDRNIQLDILDPNRMLIKLAVIDAQMQAQLYYQAGEIYDKCRAEPSLLAEYDAVLPRFGVSSTMMGCRVLDYFAAKKVVILNNSTAFRLARDKWSSLQVLAAQHIPIPTSSFAGALFSTAAHISQHRIPLVIKTCSGSQGVGVMLSESKVHSVSLLQTLQQAKVDNLLQDFVVEARGQDIRAFVIGDRVVAAIERNGLENDFRANIHQGGSASVIQLNTAEQQLAVLAAKTIGLDVAGVDLIRSNKGLLVLEVNACPGLDGIEKASKLDIAGLIIDYLLAMKK
ncbi:ribosomal protein S6 modification protein [[Haemophilus] ducreyi]|uniref:Probable alpha-L-glutamate ligase n=2 Tax=Haemophilus ducreyi TaxID=730 RepID=RIMK_HAEDU|nr:RimK family alpha-L-glutamate ligase [[Haemophilus] ducreyi]Q7VLZ5.1 RecName: Full=Probable alpha-L-glutamate ligase [[Haemophilus] ducreyi 35000HP]AAP96074.1 ribosomal protein S6 modification protein [[Haemophilus] ducreyi 35000HP]AKO31058.1 ribosomal protein S6 modification protein [[Haemophilus] ducreyi]AKO32502.1 ribosomal protein S6 modification protein [[Haemophilus] ducreyi]AKO33953.1 ribosomal protein S6 modification protein [[Haemophilus] ducreyi]AKO35400.1 ribosomal protein S6 mo